MTAFPGSQALVHALNVGICACNVAFNWDFCDSCCLGSSQAINVLCMQDRLPAKPSFYRYVLVLFVLNAVALVGMHPACLHVLTSLTLQISKTKQNKLPTIPSLKCCFQVYVRTGTSMPRMMSSQTCHPASLDMIRLCCLHVFYIGFNTRAWLRQVLCNWVPGTVLATACMELQVGPTMQSFHW